MVSHDELRIKEMNKMIAEFVGAVCSEPYPYNKDLGYHTYHFEFPNDKDNPCSYPDNAKHHVISGLKYHSSWEWMIPVWSKVCSSWTESKMSSKLFVLITNSFYEYVSKNDKSGAYDLLCQCLIVFIKSDNDNGK